MPLIGLNMWNFGASGLKVQFQPLISTAPAIAASAMKVPNGTTTQSRRIVSSASRSLMKPGFAASRR